MARRRRKPAGDLDPASPATDFAEHLRAKYLELTLKYAALVRRLENRTAKTVAHRAGRSSVYRLGYWALHVSGDALAVVQNGEITIRNARWHEFEGMSREWVRDGQEEARKYRDLSDAVIEEAAQIPARRASTTVRRYRSGDSQHVVEMRLERLEASSAPVVALVHEVTEQVRAEQELLQTREALLHSERLGILGELASSIAHELGNTLRGLTTRLAVLAQDPAVMAAHAGLLEGVRETAEAAIDSVRKLHDVARAGQIRPGPVDLADVVRHSIDVLRLRPARDAPALEIKVDIPPLPPVLGTNSELSHVFVTLLFNARDAMPSGGTIRVQAERLDGRVRVVVDDEGTGIAPEHMPNLFQPFFTTKGNAGTGLGLW